jgi:hypothetical protein
MNAHRIPKQRECKRGEELLNTQTNKCILMVKLIAVNGQRIK